MMDIFALNQIGKFRDFTVHTSMECRQLLDNTGLCEGGLCLHYKEEVHGILGRC